MTSEDLVREAQDPATTAGRLAELAQADRATWPAIVFHPQAYDGLLQWLGERGDPAVEAALAARASHVATQQAPAAPASDQHEPTVVIPAGPATSDAGTSEPTSVLPTQPADEPAGGDPKGGGAAAGLSTAAVVALVVLSVLLVGGAAFGATKIFGGGDGDQTTVAASGNATPDTVPTDGTDDQDAPNLPAPSDGGDGASSDFCSELTDIQERSMDVFGGGDGGSPDLADIQRTAQELVRSYEDLGEIAPDAIKGDIEVLSTFLGSMMDPSAGGPAGVEEYAEAAQRIGTYYATNCL